MASRRAYASQNLALNLATFGAYGDALSSITVGLEIAKELQHLEWTCGGEWFLGTLYTELFQPEVAHLHFLQADELARNGGPAHWVNLAGAWLAESFLAIGDARSAVSTLAGFPEDMKHKTLGQLRVWTARAKLADASGETSAAIAMIDNLIASRTAPSGNQDIPLFSLLRLNG